MTGSDFYEQRRLELLASLAYAAEEPFHAVIGCGNGMSLLAVALGVRRHHPLRKGGSEGTVICFRHPHQGGRNLATAELERHARLMKKKARRRYGATPVTEVVRFVEGRRGTDVWEQEIANLMRRGPERFGMVVHLGVGAEPAHIRGDIDLMLPMMSDRTEIVMCGMDKVKPQAVFRQLVRREAWSGVWHSGIALAELRRLPMA